MVYEKREEAQFGGQEGKFVKKKGTKGSLPGPGASDALLYGLAAGA